MKITNKDIIYNQYELDYSSKFCKNNNIKQKIVNLDVSFYDNGDFIKYVEPYKIRKANIAAHFWLINQCDNFPIIGGNYFWVKENNFQKCLSPMSYGSLFHDIYMKENNIQGIGNLLNYGYNGVHLLINSHLTSYKKNMDLGKLKQIIYSNLLNEDLEIRQPKHGFEGYQQKYLNSQIRNIESITWGYYTCELLNTNNTTNGKR